jgi:nucleoside 2-deoxyribosyltransferase
MTSEQKCPICGLEAYVADAGELFGDFISCGKCGKIIIEDSASSYFKGKDSSRFRACLYYYLNHFSKNNKKTYLVIDGDEKSDKYNTVSVQEINSIYPRNISERIDLILQNLAILSGHIGAEIRIPTTPGEFEHILFIGENGSSDERNTILEMMVSQGLIVNDRITKPPVPIEFLRIAFSGWQRIDELNKINSLHLQGFIAMKFDDSMKEIQQAIEQAISDAGYIPQIMNKHQHNGQVIPEMLYQIRMSDFLVADLTGNRGGVYFEAGYALGLKKEVIFTVNQNILDDEEGIPPQDRRNSPHFDVAQYNQIRYTSPEDLTQKLKDRIVATVGDRRNR